MENEENKGMLNDILNGLMNAFNKFMSLLKKHGIMTVIISMVLFIFLYSLIIYPINIGSIVEERIKKHTEEIQTEQINKVSESIERRENANYFVAEMMLNIISKYHNINRVLLLEKHNGSSNLNGVDFLYSSATYELVNDSIENPTYLFDDLQKQTNINLLGVNLIQTLKHTDYLEFNDLKKQRNNQCRLLRKLYQSGDKQAVIYSFKDKRHRPLIMLIVSGDNLNIEDITEYINQFRTQIEELLIE